MLRMKSILPKEDAERIAVEFRPQKFPLNISEAAHNFISAQPRSSSDSAGTPSFRIDRIVADQTGVAELERQSIEEQVEQEALRRLKSIQEQAYQEAYTLGMDEGRERAFQERSAELEKRILHLDETLASIEKLKSDIVSANEGQIVRLVFYLCKRLVFHEMSVKPEIVLEIVRDALQSAQTDEKVLVRVSAADFKFIESVKEKLGKDYDAIKKVKFEASEEVLLGGCIVETNFGDVNATLERRVEVVWSAIEEKLPKIKKVMAAGPGNEGGEEK